jgi:hypothetical protein
MMDKSIISLRTATCDGLARNEPQYNESCGDLYGLLVKVASFF